MTFVASPKTIAIGVCAGLASALLVLSPVGGSLLSVPLTILAGLPLVIVALGWGTSIGTIAVLAGTGTLAAVSPGLALYFVVFLAPAAVIGSHMVGMSRDAATDAQDPAPSVKPAKEWYPLGRVLVLVALLVVIGSIMISVSDGFDPSAVSDEKTRGFAEQYAAEVSTGDDTINAAELADRLQPAISTMLRILPFAFTLTWTLVAVFNLGLGIWITWKSGNLMRSREDLAGFDVPRAVLPVLAVATAVSFTGGIMGAIGEAFAGSLAALLLLAGLSVLHTVTRPLSFRVPVLVLVYLFFGLCAVPLAIAGAAEPYIRLRQRVRPIRTTLPPTP